MRIAAFVPDLMDRSKISAAVDGVAFVASPGDLVDAEADVVVIDLGRPGSLDVLADLPGRVVAFARHTERDTIAFARSAGCDEVLARSEFFRRLPDLLT